MKKFIVLIAILLSHIMAISAIAKCPFSYTVYIRDGDSSYSSDVPFSSARQGYPAMPKVLEIEPLREVNPYNPNIQFTKDNHWDFTCYWQSYVKIMNCHYFMISEKQESCSRDVYKQATKFRVIIGTQATPRYPDGTLNLREGRSGRNCIITFNAGQDTNLELDGPPNCTNNIQLDIKDKTNPLNLYEHGGEEEKTLKWFPHLDPETWFRYTTNSDYVFYPEFSTPKK